LQLRVVPEHQLTAHPPAVIAGALETFAEETIQLAELVDRVLAGRRHPRRAVSGQAGRRSNSRRRALNSRSEPNPQRMSSEPVSASSIS
jgi:hypothetical protein